MSKQSVALYNPPSTRLARVGNYPEINTQDNYRNSLTPRKKIPLELLRIASRVTPVARAIRRVQRTVKMMPWQIFPPKEDRKNETSLKRAEEITKALKRPNRALGQNTYQKLISACIKDLLILNFAAVQRMPHDEKIFQLWAVDASNINHNPTWEEDSDVARYHYVAPNSIISTPLRDEDLFLIQIDSSTYELVPPSPVEIAFPHVVAWLALHNFQHSTTSKVSAKYILDLGDISQAELNAFRDYWEEHIEEDGQTPIAAGKGAMKAVTLGATNDSELYLQYHDVLLTMIAICFDMTRADMGLENFTYATAGVSASASFQEGIKPVADAIIEHLDIEVVDFFEPGFTIEYVDTQPSTEKEERESACMLFEKNVATRNEVRLLSGLDTMGSPGDKFADGSGIDGTPAPQPEVPGMPGTNPANGVLPKESASPADADKATDKKISQVSPTKEKLQTKTVKKEGTSTEKTKIPVAAGGILLE